MSLETGKSNMSRTASAREKRSASNKKEIHYRYSGTKKFSELLKKNEKTYLSRKIGEIIKLGFHPKEHFLVKFKFRNQKYTAMWASKQSEKTGEWNWIEVYPEPGPPIAKEDPTLSDYLSGIMHGRIIKSKKVK